MSIKTTSTMKVLHILNELKHSGAEVMLQLAHQRFKDSSIESHILSTGDGVGDYADVLAETGYKIHHIPVRRSRRFFSDVGKLLSLLKKEKIAVVHIHTERAFVWYALTARMAGIRHVVRTFHNVFVFSGYLHWRRYVERKISRKVVGAVHTAIGESVLGVEKERYDNNCVLIRNWTDVDRFRPPSKKERIEARRKYEVGPDEGAVVTIGACDDRKNHIALFSAVKKANKCLTGRKLITLHVGSGPMVDEEQLYVRQHGIGEYCRFIGTLDDVRPCLYAADAFVMTSLWEGLGMAAVEAMSTGLPVILYNVHGLRDLLQDGRGGLLIEPREDRLVEALVMMVREPRFRKVKGQEARQKALETYSLQKSVDMLIELYRTGKCNDDNAESDGNCAVTES